MLIAHQTKNQRPQPFDPLADLARYLDDDDHSDEVQAPPKDPVAGSSGPVSPHLSVRSKIIDLTQEGRGSIRTPQEVSAAFSEGIKDLEEFAGPLVDRPCTMTPELAALEADMMLMADPNAPSGGSSRVLPKGKRPAAATAPKTKKTQKKSLQL